REANERKVSQLGVGPSREEALAEAMAIRAHAVAAHQIESGKRHGSGKAGQESIDGHLDVSAAVAGGDASRRRRTRSLSCPFGTRPRVSVAKGGRSMQRHMRSPPRSASG